MQENSTKVYSNIFHLSYQYILLSLWLVLWSACANRVSPSGGPKDVTPPTILQAVPATGSTNVKMKTLTFVFDEFVQLKSPRKEILISPYVKQAPTFKLKNKSLTIKFEESLAPNTTYSINFGKSIQDITENNPLGNYPYVFSTGPVIDSLFISGKVVLAKDNEAVKDALVGLYKTGNDSLFTQQPPIYVTKTTENGSYRLQNLAAGSYQLVALTDQNNNFFYDLGNEDIAFLADTISLPVQDSTQKTAFTLRLFNEGKGTAKLVEKNNKNYGQIELLFDKPQDTLVVTVLDDLSKDSLLIEQSEKNDTVLIWYNNVDKKSLAIRLETGTNVIDTIRFKRLADTSTVKRFVFISNMRGGRGGGLVDLKKDLQLEFTHPIRSFDKSKVRLLADSTTLPVSKFIYTDREQPRKIWFRYDWKPSVTYTILFPDQTLTSFFGTQNDTIKMKFKTIATEKYGNLVVTVNQWNPEKAYIFQLIDSKSKVIVTKNLTSKQLSLNYLTPDEYRIRIIEDENKNKQWDVGNYWEKKQAEPVFTTTSPIKVKANWDTEVSIKVGN